MFLIKVIIEGTPSSSLLYPGWDPGRSFKLPEGDPVIHGPGIRGFDFSQTWGQFYKRFINVFFMSLHSYFMKIHKNEFY